MAIRGHKFPRVARGGLRDEGSRPESAARHNLLNVLLLSGDLLSSARRALVGIWMETDSSKAGVTSDGLGQDPAGWNKSTRD